MFDSIMLNTQLSQKNNINSHIKKVHSSLYLKRVYQEEDYYLKALQF